MTDIERLAIGAALFFPATVSAQLAKLEADDFQSNLGFAWKAIARLVSSRREIDVASVAAEWSQEDGQSHVADLAAISSEASPYVSPSFLESLASQIRDRAYRHRVHLTARRLAEIADPRAEASPDQIAPLIADVVTAGGGRRDTSRSLFDIERDCLERLGRIADGTEKDHRVQLGIASLDALWPIRPGGLHVVAGRPGMGKTMIAAHVALSSAKQGLRTHFFSFEMDTTFELWPRLIAVESGEPLDGVLVGRNIASGKINAASHRLTELPMLIDDRIHSIETISGLIAANRSQVVIIDYLQLLARGTRDREAIVAAISREAKLIARSHDCAVVLLSQLSRKVEERPDKRPIMSDLRESGAIEQDADTIVMLYRPNYYDRSAPNDELEVLIRKVRNGPTGDVTVQIDMACGRLRAMPTGHQRWQKGDDYDF